MTRPSDQDGKSKTASAVDLEHYPEQNEVGGGDSTWEPDHADIAERAKQIWRARNGRNGSAEQDWVEARDELRAKRNSENTRKAGSKSGSVQPTQPREE